MVEFKQNNPYEGMAEPEKTNFSSLNSSTIPHQTGIAGAELKEAIAKKSDDTKELQRRECGGCRVCRSAPCTTRY